MQRVVIKIGTNLLTNQDGSLNTDFISGVAREVQRLLTNQKEVVVVTSGAVAAGRGELKIAKRDSETLHEKQALAAVGQSNLMQKYYKAFTIGHGITIAQVLLTPHDFENLDSIQNTHNSLNLLLKKGVIPIVNENDVTATDELKYMANDILSAKVANLIGADALILLTDVDGFCEEDPHENSKTEVVKELKKKEVKKFLDKAKGSFGECGHGGMKTKLEASRIAECDVYIANGNKKTALSNIILKEENPGSLIN